ncbi:hypothetical protein [Caulobacter mirabilis]|uniref:Uncharacterized protein n=1 Tax=Caulobacter mirabilis TaxID=69666 RepID=A0A2D2AYX4_9CAUL|nr:hypothetical protein [Caulobacter mirabilis]ATQ43216.1 hypothetical protein CSW64_12715 [Caulobacter mirabilis]
MGVTNVYLTNNLSQAVSVSLAGTGPTPLDYGNWQPNAPPDATTKICTLSRNVTGICTGDFAVMTGDDYIGSLGVLLDGHTFGSDIWYRYRTADPTVSPWVTDRSDHSVRVVTPSGTYALTVTAHAVFLGYDDLSITVAPSA